MRTPKSLKKIFPALFDKPAQESDGTKVWRDKNGDYHREYGRPAIIRANGTREWWVSGQLQKKDDDLTPEKKAHWWHRKTA